MVSPTSPPSGFAGSLRALGDSLLGNLQDRLALFSLELQEEKFRLIQTFVWISAAIFTGMLVVGFASLTLVYCVPASARALVLAGLTLGYAGTLVVLVLGLRRFLARQPRPFDATLQEIGEDRACIRSKT